MLNKRAVIIVRNAIVVIQELVDWNPEKILKELGLNHKERKRVIKEYESEGFCRNYRRNPIKNKNQ